MDSALNINTIHVFNALSLINKSILYEDTVAKHIFRQQCFIHLPKEVTISAL